MSTSSNGKSLLETLGAELVDILAPVSACMLIVVLLVRALAIGGGTSEMQSPSVAMLIYNEDPSDSDSHKFVGALLNALVFVAFVTLVTFLLVALFYCGFTKFLKAYMAFSTFIVLGYMGGALSVLLIQAYSIPIDAITFLILILNFAVVGMLSVFSMVPMPIVFTQGYLVLVGVLVAFWFSFLPEWTTWVLLLAMAAYDVAAVLLPGGPLNLLVKMAMERNEQLPALVYEARPVEVDGHRRHHQVTEVVVAPSHSRRHEGRLAALARFFRVSSSRAYHNLARDDNTNAACVEAEISQLQLPVEQQQQEEEEQQREQDHQQQEEQQREQHQQQQDGRRSSMEITSEESIPLVSRHIQPRVETLSSLMADERTAQSGFHGSGSDADPSGDEQLVGSVMGGGIKLGLGDFVFYSVLVGRAAMYDLMTVYACYLAIVAGLGATLVLLAFWRRALPALPISISLGVVFYLLTRLLMDPFVVQLATHLVFF